MNIQRTQGKNINCGLLQSRCLLIIPPDKCVPDLNIYQWRKSLNLRLAFSLKDGSYCSEFVTRGKMIFISKRSCLHLYLKEVTILGFKEDQRPF